MKITGIIDPPGPFAPADEWRAFIEELKKLPADEEVDQAIADAEESLALVEAPEDDEFSDLQQME